MGLVLRNRKCATPLACDAGGNRTQAEDHRGQSRSPPHGRSTATDLGVKIAACSDPPRGPGTLETFPITALRIKVGFLSGRLVLAFPGSAS